MFTFILALLLIAASVVMLGLGRKTMFKDGMSETDVNFRAFAVIPLLIGLLVLFLSSFTTVDGGYVGVPKTFGSYGTPITEGANFVAPWADVVDVEIRTKEYTMTSKSGEGAQEGDDSVSVTASDQVTIGVDATVLYHVDAGSADKLIKDLGEDYVGKIIRPTSRQVIRDVGTQYAGIDLVTAKRQSYAEQVKEEIVKKVAPYGVTIDDVKIRDMALPPALEESVNAKATAAQAAEQKINELRGAQLQADIDRTKAQATADSQQIVACGGHTETVTTDGQAKQVVVPNKGDTCDQRQLTPEFLQYAYIQALQGLVNAPNNSTLILPMDQKLTPLLNLNQSQASAPTTTAPPNTDK